MFTVSDPLLGQERMKGNLEAIVDVSDVSMCRPANFVKHVKLLPAVS